MFPFDPYSCLGSGVAVAVLVLVGVVMAGKETRTSLKSTNNPDTKCFPT